MSQSKQYTSKISLGSIALRGYHGFIQDGSTQGFPRKIPCNIHCHQNNNYITTNLLGPQKPPRQLREISYGSMPHTLRKIHSLTDRMNTFVAAYLSVSVSFSAADRASSCLLEVPSLRCDGRSSLHSINKQQNYLKTVAFMCVHYT